jgi:hypothetical protein
MKSAPAQFRCSFPLFQRLQKLQGFLKTFSNAFQAILSVEFKFVLKPWSSNSCLICGPAKIPSLTLASLILGNFFTLSMQSLPFVYPSLSQIGFF